jgi:hypothetical protein
MIIWLFNIITIVRNGKYNQLKMLLMKKLTLMFIIEIFKWHYVCIVCYLERLFGLLNLD